MLEQCVYIRYNDSLQNHYSTSMVILMLCVSVGLQARQVLRLFAPYILKAKYIQTV
jgi:hypothetical protein